jgi:hypothetical protein
MQYRMSYVFHDIPKAKHCICCKLCNTIFKRVDSNALNFNKTNIIILSSRDQRLLTLIREDFVMQTL